MRGHARELGLALLLLTGCTQSRPAAPASSGPPSPSPSVSASPPASPSPAGRAYVIGVLGDYGIDEAPVRQVVALMAGFNGGRPLDAVLTTGDNAYGTGQPGEAAFAARMLAPLLRPGTRLYAAFGNHDVVTAGGAHVRRALRMPAAWYTARVGPVEVVVLDANRPTDAAQLAFVRKVLRAPRPAAYRVVVFHQPAMSCSFHGPDTRVVSAWLPLFRGRVDLVLTGHNHTYERFAAAGGTPYVTTGGGGARLYPSLPGACHGPGTARKLLTVHHAVRLTATADRLLVEGVGLDGVPFDSVTVRPRAGR
jgi:hypothetical protein